MQKPRAYDVSQCLTCTFTLLLDCFQIKQSLISNRYTQRKAVHISTLRETSQSIGWALVPSRMTHECSLQPYLYQLMKMCSLKKDSSTFLPQAISNFHAVVSIKELFSKVAQRWPRNGVDCTTVYQHSMSLTRYNSFNTTFSIIEKAITHLSSNRPTAYSDSTKLVGKVHSLETFLKLKCFNASTFWSNKSN